MRRFDPTRMKPEDIEKALKGNSSATDDALRKQVKRQSELEKALDDFFKNDDQDEQDDPHDEKHKD